MRNGARVGIASVAVNPWLRDLLVLFAAIFAALWVLVGPELFDLFEPVPYSGDGLSHGFLIKTIIDVGWYPVHSPFVGAPFGSDLFDYPVSDGVNLLLIRLLALFSGDWVVVANLFYLVGFFLAGASAYVVLRRLGIASVWAIAGALLFTMLPYHFLRRGHLLLVSYAVVPLGVWLAFIGWRGPSPQTSSMPRNIGRALLVLAVGSGGVYYAFFSAFLVAVAGAGRVLTARSLRQGAPAFAVVAGIAAVVALNVAPSLVYRAAHGPNPQAAARGAWESEMYGMRLTQLVLPHAQHRIGAMRELAEDYAATAPLINENATASLGLAGTVGLAVLALVALARLAGALGGSSNLSFLAVLALAGFLLGTIGGGGAVFAYFISPMLRGYNRISVFIGFVSLAGLLIALQQWFAHVRYLATPLGVAAGAAVLALVGVLDQTPRGYPEKVDPSFASDRAFVRAAEAALPAGTMVWQIPYQPFPESGATGQMEDYGTLRGYLNSTALRWSYGAMKGREADYWIRALADHPLAEQMDLAARSGFGAVYIDRRGFPDRGAAAEKALRAKLGPPLAESRDGLLAIYRLQPTGSRPLPVEAVLIPFDTPIRFDEPVLSSLVSSVTGLTGWVPWGRWSEGPSVRIVLSRELPLRFVLRLETAMALPPSVGVDLTARVAGVQRRFKVGERETVVEIPFELAKPGKQIELLVPDPRTPRELGMNDDTRKLGIGLRSITILPQSAAR